MLSCRLIPSDSVFFSDLISFFGGWRAVSGWSPVIKISICTHFPGHLMHEEIAESSYYAHVVVNPLRTTLRRHSGSHWLETRGDRSRRYLRLNLNAGSLWNLLMCISGAVTEICLTEDLFNRARPPPWDWCYIQLLRWMNWASLGKFVCIMCNYLWMHLLTLILCCSLDLKHPGTHRCPGVTHRWSNCVFQLSSEIGAAVWGIQMFCPKEVPLLIQWFKTELHHCISGTDEYLWPLLCFEHVCACGCLSWGGGWDPVGDISCRPLWCGCPSEPRLRLYV